MSPHILDRPIWNALNTRQAEFARGGDLARRFAPDIGPLASARDESAPSLEELASLVPPDGRLILLQVEPIGVPPGIETQLVGEGVQMVAERLTCVPTGVEDRIEVLTKEDWPEMRALAALTKPGPFESGTPKLGEFWGIKENGRLLAMAGERMRLPGYTEVSGVCSHPDARGRGFARALSARVAVRIIERGEVPFLHAYVANTGAINLYGTLGFQVRSRLNVSVLRKSKGD